MPGLRYFPGMESTQRAPEPMVPDLLLFHTVPVSIDRRRQGVRYALLASLPLAFRRAEIFALIVQAPGLCCPSAWLPQLVGTRLSYSNAISPQILMIPGPKARRNRGNHPGFVRRIEPKEFRSASSVTGAGEK